MITINRLHSTFPIPNYDDYNTITNYETMIVFCDITPYDCNTINDYVIVSPHLIINNNDHQLYPHIL